MKNLYYKLLAWWKNFNQTNNPVILVAQQPIAALIPIADDEGEQKLTYFSWLGLEDDWSNSDETSELMMGCGFPRDAFKRE